MIHKHVGMLQQAADQRTQVACLQELFSSPYFCQAQDSVYYALAESIPDGPTTKLMQELARKLHMVLIVPMYEVDGSSLYYNTAAVIDADGSYLGKYRKTHIPHYEGFWERFYFQPGNLGYPVFDTSAGKIGVCICYDRHFPEVARCLGLNGAKIVLIPSATSGEDSMQVWFIEQASHAVANGYWVGTVNRTGEEPPGDNRYYGSSYFVSPQGQIVAKAGDTEDEVLVVDLDLDLVNDVRRNWQFYSNRRPDTYGQICSPQNSTTFVS